MILNGPYTHTVRGLAPLRYTHSVRLSGVADCMQYIYTIATMLDFFVCF